MNNAPAPPAMSLNCLCKCSEFQLWLWLLIASFGNRICLNMVRKPGAMPSISSIKGGPKRYKPSAISPFPLGPLGWPAIPLRKSVRRVCDHLWPSHGKAVRKQRLLYTNSLDSANCEHRGASGQASELAVLCVLLLPCRLLTLSAASKKRWCRWVGGDWVLSQRWFCFIFYVNLLLQISLLPLSSGNTLDLASPRSLTVITTCTGYLFVLPVFLAGFWEVEAGYFEWNWTSGNARRLSCCSSARLRYLFLFVSFLVIINFRELCDTADLHKWGSRGCGAYESVGRLMNGIVKLLC